MLKEVTLKYFPIQEDNNLEYDSFSLKAIEENTT